MKAKGSDGEMREAGLDARALGRARILVVGDAMLDRYWFGEVTRISPEAPVPIVKFTRAEEQPGGAANVARNAAALGARVSLLSVIGDDEPGGTLQQLIEKEGITACLHRDGSIRTTVKLRMIGGARRQQLLRVDFETPPSREVLLDKLADYRRLLADCDVVILSDYGKGGLAHIAQMIGLARGQGKLVLVDPKGHDYSRYEGATVVTPNRDELTQVVGPWADDAELAHKARALRERLKLDALLVTLGEKGMTLFDGDRARHEPARVHEVSDVSGAGDTVIATLGVMLAIGKPVEEAMRIANAAAGVKVTKFGATVVRPDELIAALS
jgi:D-glycero-beta-D-manno-heptose-7-phosphate kinase